jgi:hypothetical protein
MLARHPKRLIVDGIDLNFADSREELRKRTTDCRRLELPPLLDYLHGDEIGNEAHLLGHSKDSGMAPIDGYEFYWN